MSRKITGLIDRGSLGRWQGWLLASLLLLPTTALGQEPSAGSAVVLLYHRFEEPRYHEASVSLALFEAQLAELTSGPYHLLSVPQLVADLEAGRPLPDRGVVVTIDDGFLSAYRHAWPRLQAAGVPFTLYISPEPLDRGLADYMSWDQLREMAADPLVTVGSHGYAHAHMVSLSPAAARADLARATRRLEEELGRAPESFAYPYGEYGLTLRELVIESGVRAAFGTQSGAVGQGDDVFALPRFNIGGDHAEMARFDMVANVLPLPLIWIAPSDPLLDPAREPQPLSYRLAEAVPDRGVTCYYGGQLLDFEASAERVFTTLLPDPVRPGRHRINCTSPGPEGRWRWRGLQLYMPRGGG